MPVTLGGNLYRIPLTWLRTETDEDAKVSCIGPAGEKLVLFSCIMNEMHRAAGRKWCGGGHGFQEPKGRVVSGSGAVKSGRSESL